MSMPVANCGFAKNITGTTTVCAGACQMLGFYVNNTSSGTITVSDGPTALSGTITPAIGWHHFPANCGTSMIITKTGGSIDLTAFFANAN